MNEIGYEALEQALVKLAAGEKLSDVIKFSPDLEAEIETAQLLQSLSSATVPSAVAQRSRTRVLSRAMELRQQTPMSWGWLRLRAPQLVVALILAIVFLISWNGFLVASAQALPGDQLYPAKLTLEKLRLGLALNHQTHQKVEEEFQARRIDEVKHLLELGRIEFVEFLGIVEYQWTDHWIIEGLEIRLLPETIVLGEIQPGMKVEIEGITQPGGWVQAAEIHLKNFFFIGTVEEISESAWMISGREVLITSQSQVSPGIRVGDLVFVDVSSDDLGTLTVVSIILNPEVDPDQLIAETPMPSEDAQNEIEDTPEGRDETSESESEEDSGTEEPDEINEPDEMDESEESDEPDEPDETDEPEETDKPDETDGPGDAHETDEPDEPDENDEP